MQNDQDDTAAELGPLARVRSPYDFAGQRPFIQGEDWHNNAMQGWSYFPSDKSRPPRPAAAGRFGPNVLVKVLMYGSIREIKI